jgi:hypothetical protein
MRTSCYFGTALFAAGSRDLPVDEGDLPGSVGAGCSAVSCLGGTGDVDCCPL